MLPNLICQALSLDFAFRQAETKHKIPEQLLKAIAITESGRAAPSGDVIPWPWTLNIEGEGKHFQTKQEAMYALHGALAKGKKSIDVGIMQINILHHPQAFKSYEQILDPVFNINYAAQFIEQLKKDTKNWRDAIGRYHSALPKFNGKYRNSVLKTLEKLRRGVLGTKTEKALRELEAIPSSPESNNTKETRPTWSLLSKIKPAINQSDTRLPRQVRPQKHADQNIQSIHATNHGIKSPKGRLSSGPKFFPVHRTVGTNPKIVHVNAQKRYFNLGR